ncbi:FUSC family protein [Mycobacterium sp. C31M]
MTEPSDNTSTRPISVAELLAKNGSIGAPAPGGRRRRRRGNADAVTVAELTGEIPIIREPILDDDEPEVVAEQAVVDQVVAEAPTAEESVVEEPVVDEPAEESVAEPVEETAAEAVEEAAEEPAPEADEVAAAEAPTAEAEPVTDTVVDDTVVDDYEAHLQQRDAEPEPVPFQARRRAHGFGRRGAEPHEDTAASRAGIAEEMSPDPLLDEADETDTDADGPSYLKSPADTLFGGDSVADKATRRTRLPGPEDIDFDDTDEPHEGSPFMRGLWIVVQSVLAVALGAGLFIAFDQLWKWNNIVALALSVLVILGLVVGVRVVRKTEDIASTLIAVAVGAMVTLGPLALLQST